MGLPLFITPKEPEAHAKSPDKIASIPRSAIRRRQGPSRPRTTNPNSLRRGLLGSLAHVREGAYQLWEGANARQAAEEAEFGLGTSIHSRAQRMLEEEQSRIRESPRFLDSQSPSNRESDGPAMPAVPEADTFARSHDEALRSMQRSRQGRDQLRRAIRRHAAPTPPYYDDPELTGANDFGAPRRMPPYDFAPPPFSTFESSPPPISSLTPALSPVPHSGNSSPRPPGEETEPFSNFLSRMQSGRSSLTERVHALNRASSEALNRASTEVARSRTQLRQARIHLGRLDGLGDRNRSLSPEGGSAWDTLLTSITPDPQQPSASSSFASTSAATATASMSNSIPSSTNTSMTGSREIRDPTLRDCDLSDGSSTDEEDEDDIYELREFNNSRSRGGEYSRTYASPAVTLTSDPEHLDGMHHIISRLAERDEIPDEWWASAGLSRRNLRREPST